LATILKYHNNGFCDNGEYAASRIQRVWRGYIIRLHLARLGNTINGWSATIRTQLKWKESLAVKLSLKLKKSTCHDPSKVDCIPSHTSGISQSSSSSLTYAVDNLTIDLDGEALDDLNGSLERPQDTTRAALKDSVPKDDTSWGGWSSEQCTDTKAEKEWGVLNDTSCYVSNVHLSKKDTITCTTVQIKDWQWIDIMARKFASRAITTYGLLSHKMLLTLLILEIVGSLGNLFLDFGCFVPTDAQLWGVIDQDYNIYTLTQDLKDLQFSGNTLLSGTGSHPSQYVYHIKFGSSVSSLYISIDSIYHSTIYNRTCDDIASRSNKTNGITHHQRNETITNDSNTAVCVRADTPSTEDNCMNKNLYTSTQQHVNDTSTIAKHCNTLWLNINKDRAHVNCRSSAIGIRSTFIGNTFNDTSDMNRNVHVTISLDGERTNNVSSGSCYTIGINNTNNGTVGIVRTNNTCWYGSINDVYNSSDNSYGHDIMNDTHTKSGNNVPDTTQQYTNSSSTIYQDGTCCNIHSNMIQDIMLNLRCDKSYYALRGLTSIKSSFTTNDTMNHILDMQRDIHGKTMERLASVQTENLIMEMIRQSLLEMGRVY